MTRSSSYATAAITLLLAATPGLTACGNDDSQSTPGAGTGSATPASTETADPSRRGPAFAELNRAARDAFVTCAQQHDELGLIVGFRDDRAVSDTRGGAGGGEFDTRLSAPRAIAAILEDGGQYVGLREGEGPDLDILFLSETEAGEDEPSPSSMIDEEAGETAVVGAVFGTTPRGHFQSVLLVSLDKVAPKSRKRWAHSTPASDGPRAPLGDAPPAEGRVPSAAPHAVDLKICHAGPRSGPNPD